MSASSSRLATDSFTSAGRLYRSSWNATVPTAAVPSSETVRILLDASSRVCPSASARAWSVADTAGLWPAFGDVTADLVYVRLHGATELYMSGYTPDELDAWAARIEAWADGSGTPDGRPRHVYVCFDNDGHGHAPHDAVALASRIKRA